MAPAPNRQPITVMASWTPWAAISENFDWKAGASVLRAQFNRRRLEPELAAAIALIAPRGGAVIQALAAGRQAAAKAAVRSLAGLGPGSTPAGDDYLIGLFYGLRMLGEGEQAVSLAAIAAPLTTTQSALWLISAARGETSSAWAELLAALLGKTPTDVHPAAERVLNCGHSSGAASVLGFLEALAGLNERGGVSG